METSQNCYCSVNKFVAKMNEEFKGKNKTAAVYFEASESFKNQYDHTCVKPVFILLSQEKKQIVIKHKQIIEMFKGDLVISFTENSTRKIPIDTSLLCCLMVDFESKEYNENTFYPSIIKVCNNESSITRIRGQVENKVIFDDTEIPAFE